MRLILSCSVTVPSSLMWKRRTLLPFKPASASISADMSKLFVNPNSPCAEGAITIEFAGNCTVFMTVAVAVILTSMLRSRETALSVISAPSILITKPFGSSISNTLPLSLISCRELALIVVESPSLSLMTGVSL